MPVAAPDGTPRELYLLCKNTGYDLNNPDPYATNAPNLSEPDPVDPNYYAGAEVISYVYVADKGAGAGNHTHFMPVPGLTLVTQLLPDDSHFHNSWVKKDGGQKWTTENLFAPQVIHEHEIDTQYRVLSDGRELLEMRAKWVFVIAKCNSWTHQHWVDNGGGSTIIMAERKQTNPDADDADPSTWVFEKNATAEDWEAGYRDQIDNFMQSRFGLLMPESDGVGDSGINNDRNMVNWFSQLNLYQFRDDTRKG